MQTQEPWKEQTKEQTGAERLSRREGPDPAWIACPRRAESSRVNAAPPAATEKKTRRKPPNAPTPKQINDLAWSLAKKQGKTAREIRDLIYWPAWVSPPKETYWQFAYDATVMKNRAKRILERRAMQRGWAPPPKNHPWADHPDFSALLKPPPESEPESEREPESQHVPPPEPPKAVHAAAPCRMTTSSAPTAKERAARRAAARCAEESRSRAGDRKRGLSPSRLPAKQESARAQTRAERRHARRYAPVPAPSTEQIIERACALAREAGQTDRGKMNLLRWPRWTTPPTEWGQGFDIYWADSLKSKAKVLLEEELAALPRRKIKRIRRRNKPNLKRYWTTRSCKHGHAPPPRRRSYLPPVMAIAKRMSDSPDPPPAEPEVFLGRGGICFREKILWHAGGGRRGPVLRRQARRNPLHQCVTTFLDNKIVCESTQLRRHERMVQDAMNPGSWGWGDIFVRSNVGLGDFFGEFLRFIVTVGFFYWLLDNGSAIAKSVIQSFGQLGLEASSTYQADLSPSNLISFALELIGRACSTFGEQDYATSIVALLLSIAIALLFGMIAAMMVQLLCTAWVLVYAGTIVLGFGGGRWTQDIAINYFKTVLGLALQTFTFCLLVGIGQQTVENKAQGGGMFTGAPSAGGLAGAMSTGIRSAGDFMANLAAGSASSAKENLQRSTAGGTVSANIDATRQANSAAHEAKQAKTAGGGETPGEGAAEAMFMPTGGGDDGMGGISSGVSGGSSGNLASGVVDMGGAGSLESGFGLSKNDFGSGWTDPGWQAAIQRNEGEDPAGFSKPGYGNNDRGSSFQKPEKREKF